MLVFTKINPLKQYLQQKKHEGQSVGFVATMGALHYGHMELAQKSRQQNQITVCSIFVNPTQFNNPKDLEKYPRFIEKDILLLEENHCDVLFNPSVEEMYAENEPLLTIDLKNIDKRFEGEFRPGHFVGVATVVKKLFDIITPTKAYFGAKDYQQVLVINEVNQQYNMGIEIISVPTVRYPSGLAMSSRNFRLSEGDLQKAAIIYQTFLWAQQNVSVLPPQQIVQQAKAKINAVEGAEVEYFELADAQTLDIVHTYNPQQKIVAITAVNLSNVRLIDNMVLN